MEYSSSVDIGADIDLSKISKETACKKNCTAKIGGRNPKLRLEKYGGNSFFYKLVNHVERHNIAILLGLCLIVGFLVLSQPAFFRGIDKQVKESVLDSLQKQIQLKVDLDYPRVSKAERLKIVGEEFKQASKSPELKAVIKTRAEKIKDYYKDESGNPYIYGVDSYLFLIEARNLLEQQMTGNKIADWAGKKTVINSLREAPKGTTPQDSLVSYIEAYTFKIIRFFGFSLEQTAFWLPLVFGLLSITLIFFIAKKITNSIGGFFSAFVFSIHQRFFTGNYVGFADTNYLNMFFSLLLVFLFIHFLDFKFKKSSLCALITIFVTLLFRKTWNGYLFICVVMVLFVILYAILYLLKDLKSAKNKFLFVGLLLGTALGGLIFISTSFFTRIAARLMPYQIPQGFFRSGMDNIIELKAVSFPTLFDVMGGYMFWLFFLVGIGYIVYTFLKTDSRKYPLLLIVWLILTMVAGVLSRRFLFYATPSFALIAGIGLSSVLPLLVTFADSVQIRVRESVWKSIFVVILAFVLVISVRGDIQKLSEYKSPMNDAVYDTANFIRLNSDENAVIDTWWDLGYMYQYYSKRGTIFDPGAFGWIRQYLLSMAFITEDEKAAKRIWQIQNCAEDWDIQNQLFLENVSKVIQSYGPSNCNNSGFVVVSEDMLGKIYEMKASITNRKTVEHAYLIRNRPKQKAVDYLISELNLSGAEAEAKYRELLAFKDTAEDVKVSRISLCAQNANIILCDNGYKIEKDEVSYKGEHPDKFYSFLKDEKLVVDYDDSKADFSFILYPMGSGIYSFMIQSDLAETMIVRMFAGEKIKDFEEVYSTEFPMQVRTYKIATD